MLPGGVPMPGCAATPVPMRSSAMQPSVPRRPPSDHHVAVLPLTASAPSSPPHRSARRDIPSPTTLLVAARRAGDGDGAAEAGCPDALEAPLAVVSPGRHSLLHRGCFIQDGDAAVGTRRRLLHPAWIPPPPPPPRPWLPMCHRGVQSHSSARTPRRRPRAPPSATLSSSWRGAIRPGPAAPISRSLNCFGRPPAPRQVPIACCRPPLRRRAAPSKRGA